MELQPLKIIKCTMVGTLLYYFDHYLADSMQKTQQIALLWP